MWPDRQTDRTHVRMYMSVRTHVCTNDALTKERMKYTDESKKGGKSRKGKGKRERWREINYEIPMMNWPLVF